MTDSVNKVFLIGRAGQDAQLTYAKNGNAISKFSLVTSRRWTNDKGEKIDEPTWHKITIFGKRAEGVSKYIFKGSYLRVEGYIKNGKSFSLNRIQSPVVDRILRNSIALLPSDNDFIISDNKVVLLYNDISYQFYTFQDKSMIDLYIKRFKTGILLKYIINY